MKLRKKDKFIKEEMTEENRRNKREGLLLRKDE